MKWVARETNKAYRIAFPSVIKKRSVPMAESTLARAELVSDATKIAGRSGTVFADSSLEPVRREVAAAGFRDVARDNSEPQLPPQVHHHRDWWGRPVGNPGLVYARPQS
ncbi:MAG: hypothetical protein JRM80_08570 [Nitrososphaerota archaeon]|nr:hypothetical protein [Nitrososphaerota archaeon]